MSLPFSSIMVAPNGGRRTKQDHPALPLGPAELAATAAACREAGAAAIHIHVRDADNRHLLDADAYRAALQAIRNAAGDRMIVQITSEALGIYQPDQQMAVVKAVRPEAVSLALRELVPEAAHEPAFAAFLTWLKAERILPQIILYTPEEAARLADMQQRGVIPWDHVPVLYVLGRYTANQTSTPQDLDPFLVPSQPQAPHWSVCAFGRYEAACVLAAALRGGHMRVGFENNLWRPDGTPAQDNAAQIGLVADIAGRLGLGLLDADGLRQSWAQA
ncbi:3-keto-5-aminohexanoate cleavage protein [Methylovirgula sp. 4M-Z18]|uniref:3-keto-5-aminohexanoate cleavage protein n=1 Tax=Methylovirgula sp. 4M-Z18 TaxID=2293567 RepID=UPI000E2F5EE1|nr:3-keto-5-aminohexanoate cleavage protein [Methylovirgula sp. 4M-Z18]RFB78440.1 3-keto-5-aminohexanoate cleavage protein [Methylovirgula sp. 4M-Z18]